MRHRLNNLSDYDDRMMRDKQLLTNASNEKSRWRNRLGKVNLCELKLWEVLVMACVFTSAYYAYFYYDNLHFHVARTYAWANYDAAQHMVGQHYTAGKGVEKDMKKAMEYYRLAADQGHAAASHNLAVGHVTKHTKLKKGEARRLLNHAASRGVSEANHVLSVHCDERGMCDD